MDETQLRWHGRPINSWGQFHRFVKLPDRPLLAQLDAFDDSILVAGCQRSGTTALARLLKRSRRITDFRFGHDDELDGALLLAGRVESFAGGRRCFQTTYLNDRYPEYFEHEDFRLIWILREPAAVVYSMLHNWKRGALNRLYDACVRADGTGRDGLHARTWIGPSRLDKACASYAAKTTQTFRLHDVLGDRMLIIDYDDLVRRKEALLPRICEFADVPFEPAFLGHLHGKSVRNGVRLSVRETARVEKLCVPVYRQARELRTLGGGDA